MQSSSRLEKSKNNLINRVVKSLSTLTVLIGLFGANIASARGIDASHYLQLPDQPLWMAAYHKGGLGYSTGGSKPDNLMGGKFVVVNPIPAFTVDQFTIELSYEDVDKWGYVLYSGDVHQVNFNYYIEKGHSDFNTLIFHIGSETLSFTLPRKK